MDGMDWDYRRNYRFFFFSPVLFGCAAIILGLITVFSQANNLGWWAIGLGLVGAAANMWLY